MSASGKSSNRLSEYNRGRYCDSGNGPYADQGRRDRDAAALPQASTGGWSPADDEPVAFPDAPGGGALLSGQPRLAAFTAGAAEDDGRPPGGCPACGSDDYTCLQDDPEDGVPDYDGMKRCEECGEEWL